jgi:hypothetical protein
LFILREIGWKELRQRPETQKLVRRKEDNMKTDLLVLTDSSDKGNYRVAQETIFPFLEHFGIPYRTFDLAHANEADFDTGGILIAQAKIGHRLSAKIKASLFRAVNEGAGLVNLDHHLDDWKDLSEPLQIEEFEAEDKTSLIRVGKTHYINQLQPLGTEQTLLEPVDFLRAKTKGGPLLLSEEGSPLLVYSSSPKLVQFLVSPKLWLPDYFGHCAGLDDVLFRAIIWAVKKPFVTKTLPPFVTCRIDDANGSANIFGKREDSANRKFMYLDILNRFGYIPNIGLYLDDITEEDGNIVKAKYDKGLAEFSPHAFSDPKNINEYPIYMLHNGKEFSVRQLEENFARVDRKFQSWGIKQAKTVNAHFCETGAKAAPFLKERGIKFSMQNGVPFGYNWAGAAQGKHPTWDPKPYGNHGFQYDAMLNHPDIFNVVAHPIGSHKLGESIESTDFLWGNTTFWDESGSNNIEGAAEKGAGIIKLGLSSGFFGCLMTHEQRIATLSADEFQQTLRRIDASLSDWEKIFASYDEIAEYLYNHSQSRLKEVRIESKRISCRLSGESAIPLKLFIFREEKDEISREFHTISPFSREVEVVL